MFQVSGQNIENFSRNSYFQVGGLYVRVRVLIIVCAVGRYATGGRDVMVGLICDSKTLGEGSKAIFGTCKSF